MQIDVVIVGLVNCFVNPEHECRLGERLRSALPHLQVCLSHEVTSSQGEFERFSTAVLNGYVQPIVTGYLGQLEAKLRAHKITAPLFVMKSNGGVGAAGVVAKRSVETPGGGGWDEPAERPVAAV